MQYIALILIVILLIIGAVAVMSNSAQINSDGVDIHNPVSEAGAQATRTATDIKRRNAELDLDIRRKTSEAEIEAHQKEVEASMQVALTKSQAEAEVIRKRGEVDAQVTQAIGEAETSAVTALGQGGYIAIIAIAIGLAIAAVILATGHSIASVTRAVLAANYVQIGVEPRTLLPPPLVITVDGYLIDTRTGQRARLRDAAGVDRLRLAATTHSTETAQLAQAEIEIAKATKSDKAADALMGAANNIPMLDVATLTTESNDKEVGQCQ